PPSRSPSASSTGPVASPPPTRRPPTRPRSGGGSPWCARRAPRTAAPASPTAPSPRRSGCDPPRSATRSSTGSRRPAPALRAPRRARRPARPPALPRAALSPPARTRRAWPSRRPRTPRPPGCRPPAAHRSSCSAPCCSSRPAGPGCCAAPPEPHRRPPSGRRLLRCAAMHLRIERVHARGEAPDAIEVAWAQGGEVVRWSLANTGVAAVAVDSVALVARLEGAVEPLQVLCQWYQSWSPTRVRTFRGDRAPSRADGVPALLLGMYHADPAGAEPDELRSGLVAVRRDATGRMLVVGFLGASEHDGPIRVRRARDG